MLALAASACLDAFGSVSQPRFTAGFGLECCGQKLAAYEHPIDVRGIGGLRSLG